MDVDANVVLGYFAYGFCTIQMPKKSLESATFMSVQSIILWIFLFKHNVMRNMQINTADCLQINDFFKTKLKSKSARRQSGHEYDNL